MIKLQIPHAREHLTHDEKVHLVARFTDALDKRKVDYDVEAPCRRLNNLDGVVTVQSCSGGHPHPKAKGFIDMRLSAAQVKTFEKHVIPTALQRKGYVPKKRWLLAQGEDGVVVQQATYALWFPAGEVKAAFELLFNILGACGAHCPSRGLLVHPDQLDIGPGCGDINCGH